MGFFIMHGSASRYLHRAKGTSEESAARPFFLEENFWRLYFRLWRHVRPYWKLCIASGICMVLMMGFLAVRVWVVKPLLDALEKEKLHENLSWIFAFVVTVTVLRGIVRYTQSYLTRYIGHRSIRDLRNTVYNQLITLNVAFFDQNKSGDLLAALTSDITQVRQSVKLLFSDIFIKPLELLAYVSLMAWYNWKLTLALVPCVPLISWVIRRIGDAVKKFSRLRRAENAEMYSLINESLSGIRIIKAFNLEEYHKERFAQQTERLFQLTIRAHIFRAMSSPLMEVIIYTSVAVVAWIVLGFTSGMSLGAKGVFFLCAFMSFKPLNALTDIHYDILEALAGAERVFRLLDEKPSIQDQPHSRPLPVPHESVEFQNVSFAYRDDPVLRDISFRVKIGETIGIVGPSGAGKTTLINLLVRFYDPTHGRILIDGHDTRDIQVQSLRSHMALVTQDPIIFNDTVWNNITCGREGYTEEDVHAAAEAAYAHTFIMDLPEGYQTVVGERGTRLSGGQRQRIAIARALLWNPSILLLDEATSSLDSESEQIVQQALEKLMEGRTAFIVAHRLSTVAGADRLLVLDRGRIVEQGTHQELVARGGLYASLYEIQMQPAVAVGNTTGAVFHP